MLVIRAAAKAYGAKSYVEQHSSCCDDGACGDPDKTADAHCAHEYHREPWEAAKCATNAACERLGRVTVTKALYFSTARLL